MSEPIPANENSAVLDISVVWERNGENAPADVREAIEHLAAVLNRYGLNEESAQEDASPRAAGKAGGGHSGGGNCTVKLSCGKLIFFPV